MQVIPQTPTKPELSHPISRLCDTIEADERKETPKTETANAEKTEEERNARIFVNSDNNNNNETIVNTEVAQRGRSADDHRCDQCGKTFVTRASLKVCLLTITSDINALKATHFDSQADRHRSHLEMRFSLIDFTEPSYLT